jgi:hypothetical protein
MKSLIALIFLFFPLVANSMPDGSSPAEVAEMSAPFSMPSRAVALSNTLDLTNITNSRSSGLMPAVIVLFLAAIIIAFQVYLASIDVILSEFLFKCILITLVITGSLVLVTIFYSDSALTGITVVSGVTAACLMGKAKFPGDSSMKLLKDKKNRQL